LYSKHVENATFQQIISKFQNDLFSKAISQINKKIKIILQFLFTRIT